MNVTFTKEDLLARLKTLEMETMDPTVSAIKHSIENGRPLLDALFEGFRLSVMQRIYLQDAMNEVLLKTPPTVICTVDQKTAEGFKKGVVEDEEEKG